MSHSLDGLFPHTEKSDGEFGGIATDFSMESWFDSATTPDNVTVQDFDKYVEEYLSERRIADDIEEKLTAQNKKVMAMSSKLMEFLDVMGKTKHVVPSGTIQKIETSQWRPPEGEGRENIIQILKDNGQYDDVTSFNAAKFSSWYKAEQEGDPDFSLAGVEKKITKYIKFNKAKG
jgi:hypothetical protein